MGSVHYADGREVQHDEYMDTQVGLIASCAEELLQTGPEERLLTGQDWKHLDTVKRNGMRDREAYDALRKQEILSYLFQHWVNRYAAIFGPLARVNGTPIETVTTLVSNFQSRVNAGIGQLRYLWQEHAGSSLPLQSALEQVRWNGPSVIRVAASPESTESTGYPFLEVSALMPYVEKVNGHAELLFDTDHIAHSTFIHPLNIAASEAVRGDVAQYTCAAPCQGA